MTEFRVCPSCGYGRGFHVYLRPEGEGSMRVGLICPSCGASFDLGWVVQGRLPEEATAGPVFPDRG
ncbi:MULTISPECIES: hypothetical protein [Deferrisoma]